LTSSDKKILFSFFKGDYDYEYDSIEQVSDYDNSESDDSNADLYSIVSTRKPKLEPFFKNNSNPDLRSLNSDGLLLNIKTEKSEDKIHKPVCLIKGLPSTPL